MFLSAASPPLLPHQPRQVWEEPPKGLVEAGEVEVGEDRLTMWTGMGEENPDGQKIDGETLGRFQCHEELEETHTIANCPGRHPPWSACSWACVGEGTRT